MSSPPSFLVRRAWLGLLLCSWLMLAAPMLAQAQSPDEDPTPKQQLQQVEDALNKAARSWKDAETTQTLKALSDKANQAARDADAVGKALQPKLEQLKAQRDQLGEVLEDAPESHDIANQRRALNKRYSELDAQSKIAAQLATSGRQLASDIDAQRASQFNDQLMHKVASPLSVSLWAQVVEQLPADAARVAGLYQMAQRTLKAAIQAHGWSRPLLGLLAAVMLMFPLRIWLRALGRRFAASERAPDTRLRRSGLALWLLLVGTLLPTWAVMVLMAALDSIDAIPDRLQSVAEIFEVATFLSAFIVSLSACLLVPERSSWRLLNLDDTAALRLRKYAWGAGATTWLVMVLVTVDREARTSEVSNVALDGLIALTYLGLIMAMLVTLARLHRRQTAEAEAQLEAAAANDGHVQGGPVRRSSWLVVARVAGNLAVGSAIIATLLGYLNLAKFVNQQLVWGGVIAMATILLLKFVDDFCTWLLNADSRVGQTILLSTGLSVSRVEQAGVLLSAALRIVVLALAVLALVAPFGNLDSVLNSAESLAAGFDIGGAHLSPGSVALAVGVLLAGLALTALVQRWLADTYLPKTELDLGARNSISTVARYLGIVLSVIWALNALGLDFKKLALVVSALSVGIGFGLQAITQNFVSGLILLAERPVKIGDWVKLGDQEGDIRRINVRSTEIQVGDKSTLIVPNSELITKTIRNMTMGSAQGRIQIQFAVPNSTDVGALRQALLDAYSAHASVLKQPAPTVYIDSIAGGQIAMNSYAHVASPRQVYATRSDLYFSLLKILAERGIALSTPTDIHLVRDSVREPAPENEPQP